MTFGLKHSMRRHFKSAHSSFKQTGFCRKINSSSSKSKISSPDKSNGQVNNRKRKVSFESSEEEYANGGDFEDIKPDWHFWTVFLIHFCERIVLCSNFSESRKWFEIGWRDKFVFKYLKANMSELAFGHLRSNYLTLKWIPKWIIVEFMSNEYVFMTIKANYGHKLTNLINEK